MINLNAMQQRSAVAFIALVVLAGLAVLGWFGYQSWQKAHYAYTIPGVPTLNLYDSQILNTGLQAGLLNPGTSAVIDVLRYWGDSVDLSDQNAVSNINAVFASTSEGGINPVALQAFFASRGYTVTPVYIQNPQDLEKYINPRMPVPLLFSQMVSPDNLVSLNYTLLIGLDMNKGTVVTNDFLHGQTYTMSLSDFNHLWDIYPYGSYKFLYFAVYPSDPSRIASRIAQNANASAYPPRTAPMDALAPLLPTYQLSNRLRVFDFPTSSTFTTELGYLQTMTASPLFSNFHPSIQTKLYAEQAQMEIALKQYPAALADANKAISLDQNLNAPFSGWGQFNYQQISFPYYILAQYYKAVGNSAKEAAAAAQEQQIVTANNSSQ